MAAARRAAQAQQAETTGPRTIEDYEALRRNLPSYRAQPSQTDYEALRRNLPAYRAQPSQAAYEALRQNLPSYAPAPQEKKPWWLSSSAMEAARALALTLPSAQVDAWRNAVPAFSFVSPGHVISFGKVSSGMVATDANPGLAVNLDGYLIAATGIQPITTLTPRVDGFDLNVRNPVQKYEFLEGASKVRVSSSVTARVTWGGFWNTTVGVDVNMLEVQVHSGGMKGRASHGVYVEWKPGRLVTYAVAAPIVVGGLVLLAYYLMNTGDVTILEGIPAIR